MKLKLRILLFFVILFLMIHKVSYSESDSTHHQIVKSDIRSLVLLGNKNYATKTVRIDYQYFIKTNRALSFGLQIGNFNSYSYTKYFDFFGDFNYTKEVTDVRGFHFYSSYDFFPLRKLNFFIKNFSVSPAVDMNFYNKHKEIFFSKTNLSTKENFNTFQFSFGISVAYRQKIWRNISIDALLDSQFKIFSFSSSTASAQVPLTDFHLNTIKKST